MTVPLLMGGFSCSRSDLYQLAEPQEENSLKTKCLFLWMRWPAALTSSRSGPVLNHRETFICIYLNDEEEPSRY